MRTPNFDIITHVAGGAIYFRTVDKVIDKIIDKIVEK